MVAIKNSNKTQPWAGRTHGPHSRPPGAADSTLPPSAESAAPFTPATAVAVAAILDDREQMIDRVHLKGIEISKFDLKIWASDPAADRS